MITIALVRGENLTDGIVEKIFEGESLEGAIELAAQWITGDGLPCSGAGGDVFTLWEVKPVENEKWTMKNIWVNALLIEALKPKK